VATLEIKTADEFTALDLEDRWRTRRAARETELSRRILRMFLDRGGPIPVKEIGAAFDGPHDAIDEALCSLDADDLIRIRDGQVDIAYPFSASPTPFAVRLPGGKQRYACCAVDALGIAPMVGQGVDIQSRCHDCGDPLHFSVTPDGPGPEADGIMLWVGKRADDRCKIADSL
jgi:hypothetical protein